jgi:glycosyltransferase involved in cell wall biosynthesis
VIVLLHPAPAYGAVERYVEAIARAIREETLLVHPGVEEFESLPVRTVQIDPSVATLVQLLRSARPRLVHVTDVWPQAVIAARLARVPRVLVTHHTPELPRRDNVAGRVWQRLGWAVRPEVIYTSEADRERDRRSPSHVVNLGIDVERFASGRAVLPKREGRPLVGNVARLAPQKDHRTLLGAAALMHEADFAIAGEGELRDELEREAGPNVRLLGRRADVPDVLASLDVFAFPSLYEGLCLAVIEAQAAGVPVVATGVGGIKESVVDGETGLLVPPRDPEALAAAIRWVLEHPVEAGHIADEARRRSGERYSLQRMIDETLALYG